MVTGASAYMAFRGKSGIEILSSELRQLWKILFILYILSMKRFLKSFAIGRGKFPLGNIF